MAVKSPPLYVGRGARTPMFALMTLMALALSAFFIAFGTSLAEPATHRFVSRFLLVLWGLVPPLWFVVEYFYYFPAHGNPEAGFEALKGAQSVLTKAWLTVIVLLGLLYTVQFPTTAA